MIEITEVTKIFKNKEGDLHAVNQVSLSISDGQIYGIVGYSGAGKSTLVRCINFQEKPDSGSISVSGFGTIRHQDGKGYYRPEGEGARETALTEKHLKALRRRTELIFQVVDKVKKTLSTREDALHSTPQCVPAAHISTLVS